jgi:hypothetical protein
MLLRTELGLRFGVGFGLLRRAKNFAMVFRKRRFFLGGVFDEWVASRQVVYEVGRVILA